MTRSRYDGDSGGGIQEGGNIYEMLQWQTSSSLYEPTLTPIGLEGFIIGATAFPADEKDGIYAVATVTTEKIGRGGNFELRQTGIANGTSAGTGFFGAAYTAGANDFDHIHGSQSWVFAEGSGTVGRIAAAMATVTINSGQTVTDLMGLYLPSPTINGTITNRWGVYALDGAAKSFFRHGVFIEPNAAHPSVSNAATNTSLLCVSGTTTQHATAKYLTGDPTVAIMSTTDDLDSGIGGRLGLGGVNQGTGDNPFVYGYVIGGPDNATTTGYRGRISLWTSSDGEGAEAASASYERMRLTPTQATLYQGLEVQGNVGFYATTPVTQNQLATGVGATVDNVITELQRLGLVRQAA